MIGHSQAVHFIAGDNGHEHSTDCIVAAQEADAFDLLTSVFLMAAMVVGGQSSLLGSVIGGLVYVYLPDYASEVSEALAGVVYGAAVILLMLVMPSGLSGLLRAGAARLAPRLASVRSAAHDCPLHRRTDQQAVPR